MVWVLYSKLITGTDCNLVVVSMDFWRLLLLPNSKLYYLIPSHESEFIKQFVLDNNFIYYLFHSIKIWKNAITIAVVGGESRWNESGWILSTVERMEGTRFGPRRGSHLIEVELQSLDNSGRYKNRGTTFTWHIAHNKNHFFLCTTCNPLKFYHGFSTWRNQNPWIRSPTLLTVFWVKNKKSKSSDSFWKL